MLHVKKYFFFNNLPHKTKELINDSPTAGSRNSLDRIRTQTLVLLIPHIVISYWTQTFPHTLPFVARTVKNLPQCRRPRFNPWVGKIPWRREWQPTPVFLSGESHGQRSLVGSMGSQRVRHESVSDWHFYFLSKWKYRYCIYFFKRHINGPTQFKKIKN